MILITKELPDEFKDDIIEAIKILNNAGCKEVYIFGSLVRGNYNEFSDIDIAVRGLSKKIFFEIGGKLLMNLKHKFDLVELEEGNSFSEFIEENEVFIRVA
ncbi:MAG: hypothetical protein B6I28_04110 [Fusobacteriia bacterium 4572_132]|nr:MAG: hypothetical protein B6I28_04110 [Fusobacteriia bacterium 4572_132]